MDEISNYIESAGLGACLEGGSHTNITILSMTFVSKYPEEQQRHLNAFKSF